MRPALTFVLLGGLMAEPAHAPFYSSQRSYQLHSQRSIK